MELEKLNKERVAIAGKLNKLELEHSRMREQFISDFSQKMEGLELEMDSFVNQKEENDPRRLEKEKRELEVSIEKQKVDAQVSQIWKIELTFCSYLFRKNCLSVDRFSCFTKVALRVTHFIKN